MAATAATAAAASSAATAAKAAKAAAAAPSAAAAAYEKTTAPQAESRSSWGLSAMKAKRDAFFR